MLQKLLYDPTPFHILKTNKNTFTYFLKLADLKVQNKHQMTKTLFNVFAAGVMNIWHLKISLNQAVFMCLSNGITPPPIALESCSNPQKIRQVLQ